MYVLHVTRSGSPHNMHMTEHRPQATEHQIKSTDVWTTQKLELVYSPAGNIIALIDVTIGEVSPCDELVSWARLLFSVGGLLPDTFSTRKSLACETRRYPTGKKVIKLLL